MKKKVFIFILTPGLHHVHGHHCRYGKFKLYFDANLMFLKQQLLLSNSRMSPQNLLGL